MKEAMENVMALTFISDTLLFTFNYYKASKKALERRVSEIEIIVK